MSTTKRCISLLLVLCMVIGELFPPVFAAHTDIDDVATVRDETAAEPMASSGTCGTNLTWTLNDEGVLTISGTGPMDDYGNIVGYNYAEPPWHSSDDAIKMVSISDGVTHIGERAFYSCSNLTDVNIPDSVVSIGSGAFLFCRKLPCITIPGSVKSMGGGIFDYCYQLTSAGPIGGGYDYEFGWTEAIPDSAFSGCKYLTHIALPDSITSIGDRAFFRCSSLTSVVIPDSVTSIGKFAFEECSGLSKVNIPDNVDSIGHGAFCRCSSLESIHIPDKITQIEQSVFSYCSSLTSVTIPDSVTSIGPGAFSNCTGLDNVTIGTGVTSIRFAAFSDCRNLEEIVFYGNAPSFEKADVYAEGVFENVSAIAYYPPEDSTWTTDVMQNYEGKISWRPYTDRNSSPDNGTYTSPQESVWYDIWCVGISRFNSEKNFTLNIGRDTYSTGESRKARVDIPPELSNSVSVSKDGWITCKIPADLVYTCREIILYPDTTETPFVQFVVARNNGDSMYTNLACSHLSVYENAMRTYDMYVDINWNGYTPGKIYLKQGDLTLDLKEGKNQGLLLGMFSASGGDVLLCWETGEGTVHSQGMYLDVYKNSVSNIKLDGGESTSGTNKASEEEDEMWGGLSFSIDLFNDTVPVELEMNPTGLNKGTFKGTIGIQIENADHKRTIIDLLDTNLDKNVDFTTFTSLKKSLETKFPKTLIPQQANAFVVSADTQFIGLVEGTYELGTDGSLVNMEFTDSKILTSINGKFSTTRQHIVTPIPWYWTMEIKAGAELALEMQNKYDGSTASIAPLNSAIELGIGAKTAVGISGAASVGVKGGGSVHIDGQALPIDFSKTEVYADYNIALYGELGPFSGEAFPYKSDKYYLWKNGKWVFSSDYQGGGGFRDSFPDTGFEMQQISREYLMDRAALPEEMPDIQLNSVTSNAPEKLIKSNTYTFTEPQIVQMENGNLLLVWVDDPGVEVRPVDINRAALFYSVYDGSTWSEPAMVSDDGTADAAPVLKSIDGNVYLLWNNANSILDTEAGYLEYCGALDIAYARFDSESSGFTDVTVINSNDYCDILPDMAAVNGIPTITWIQNSANDPFQGAGSNKLYVAQLKSGVWNVKVLADDLNTVDGLCIADDSNTFTVYLSQDTDGDVFTVEDRELFAVEENNITQVTDNAVADLKPTIIGDSLYWYQNGVLTDGTHFVQLLEDTDRYVAVTNGVEEAILYQKHNDDDSVVIYANILCDGVWTDGVEIVTIDRYIPRFDAIMMPDGSITIITNEIELRGDTYQQADLCAYVLKQECDIAVQQVSYNPLSIAPGGQLELFITIQNLGMSAENEVYVRLYQEETLLKEAILALDLLAGDTAVTTLVHPLDAFGFTDSLRIEVEPVGRADANVANNTAVCTISWSDVSVEEMNAFQTEKGTQVSSYISNRGLTVLVNVEVALYTVDGTEKSVLETKTITVLEAAMGEVVTFDTDLESDTVVYIEATVPTVEFNTGNNSEFTLVAEMSDIPEMTTKVENPFNDVAPGSFYYEPVMWAVENSITNGTSATTFSPNDQCMRAHVVTFLWRAVGSPEPTRTDNPFVDVKPSDFYYKPVLWALENGITSGMDATHFGPMSYCNRAQVVTFLYRTMGSPELESAENPFTDVAKGSFYEKPVLWAVQNGITNGLSTTAFGPNAICNRAQIVTFLYRAFVN